MKVLVTGGSGFIGSNFVHYLFDTYGNDVFVVNLDKLTYAGNPANLAGVDQRPNYRFIHGDICDTEVVADAMKDIEVVVTSPRKPTWIDRSRSPMRSFAQTSTGSLSWPKRRSAER